MKMITFNIRKTGYDLLLSDRFMLCRISFLAHRQTTLLSVRLKFSAYFLILIHANTSHLQEYIIDPLRYFRRNTR